MLSRLPCIPFTSIILMQGNACLATFMEAHRTNGGLPETASSPSVQNKIPADYVNPQNDRTGASKIGGVPARARQRAILDQYLFANFEILSSAHRLCV